MHEESTMNNNKLPYGYVSDLLAELRPRMRWVTKNIVNKAFLKYKKDVFSLTLIEPILQYTNIWSLIFLIFKHDQNLMFQKFMFQNFRILLIILLIITNSFNINNLHLIFITDFTATKKSVIFVLFSAIYTLYRHSIIHLTPTSIIL